MRLLPVVLTLLTLSLSLPSPAQIPSAAGGEPVAQVHIATADPMGLHDRLTDLGYSTGCAHPSAHGEVDLTVSHQDLLQLQAAGLSPVIVDVAAPLRSKLGRQGFPSYSDLPTINAFMAGIATAHPNLARVVDVASVYGPGSTFEGRPINVLKISDNVTQDEDEPQVLIVSCFHAREIVTPEIALDIINRLINGYGTDPVITNLVDTHEIWIAPVWNPDGFDYVWNVNSMWRKNRKLLAGGAVGVDLNRNFDLNWSSSCGGSTNPSSDTYRGPSVGSEEETQTMVAFARDRRFAKVLDYHSFGQQVLQTYNCAPMPAVVEDFIDAEGVVLAQAASPAYTTRDPSADGEHYEWEIKEITSYSFLVETATAFQPNHATALAEAARVWPQTLAFFNRPIPLTGHVSNTLTGQPVEATLAVQGVAWTQGETRMSDARFGRFHLFLPPGSYQIQVTAPGFTPRTVPATVGNGTTTLNVALTQNPGMFDLTFTTTGSGTGDLFLGMANIPPGTGVGFTLFTLDVGLPLGAGNLLGIQADALTLMSLTSAPSPFNPLHWVAPLVPGIYPLAPLVLPPGSLPFPPGTGVDAIAVALAPGYSSLIGVTSPQRIQF
jgi:hypothetical protein